MAASDKAQKRKKIFSAISFGFSALLFILALTVFITAMIAKKDNKPVSFFGYSFSIVITGSMEPEIKVGDLVVTKKANMSEVKEGDNVVFVSKGGAIAGQRVVHKVQKIGTDEEGLYFITKGVNNLSEDTEPVREDNFEGVETFHSTALGVVFGFFSRAENWLLVLVLIVTVPIAVKQIKKIIVYAKGSDEASDEEKPQSDAQEDGDAQEDKK